MEPKFVAIESYFFMVDTKAPLKRNHLVWNIEGNFGVLEGNPEAELITVRYEKSFSSVALRNELFSIIAHLPLNGSPVLEGIPVMVDESTELNDEEIMKLAVTQTDGYCTYPNGHTHDCGCGSWVEGYKAASQKQYTEEDMRKCWNYAGDFFNENKDEEGCLKMNFTEFLQSLKPVPVDFIPEWANVYDTDKKGGTTTDANKAPHGAAFVSKLKLNSEGKAMGKYIYE